MSNIDRGHPILLASGVLWYADDPRVEDVRAADFEAQRSIGRWGGHARCRRTGLTYTLAEHAVRVARLLEDWGAPADICLQGGTHDLHEVYPPGDVSTPRLRGDSPRAVALRAEERRARDVTRLALGLPLEFAPIVHEADRVLLMTERRDLMPPGHDDLFAGRPAPLEDRIEVMTPQQAWEEWCLLFEHFGGRWPQ